MAVHVAATGAFVAAAVHVASMQVFGAGLCAHDGPNTQSATSIRQVPAPSHFSL